MKNLLPAMLLLCSAATAQIPQFTDPIIEPCYGGDDHSVIEGWEVYQTLDNVWDGPRDSTICVDVTYNNWKAEFLAAQVDISRPVFMSAQVDTLWTFTPNSLWKTGVYFFGTGVIAESVDWCNDGFCSGIMAEIETPMNDSTWVSRRYFGNYDYSDFDYAAAFCTAIDYVPGSRFKTLILKLNVAEAGIASVYTPSLEDMTWTANYLDSANLDFYQSGPSEYYFYGFNGEMNNYVIPYDSINGFPSDTTISNFDVYPIPNTDVISDVTLAFEEFATLTFEPHTAIRGGLVEGSDSLRHNVIIENNGAVICMMPVFEVVLEPGSQYVHNAGSIDFSHKSCIRFQYNSDFKVGAGSTFVSGANSQGMLAFDDGARVTVNEGATLEINNGIVFFDSPWITGEQWVDVDVFEGGRIIFKDDAYVNSHVSDKRMKWRINVWGGSVDLSGLSPEDREYFVVFGEEQQQSNNAITLLGNPVSDELLFQFDDQGLTNWTYTITDKSGRVMVENNSAIQRGEHFSIATTDFPTGIYILKLRNNREAYSAKFVKQ